MLKLSAVEAHAFSFVFLAAIGGFVIGIIAAVLVYREVLTDKQHRHLHPVHKASVDRDREKEIKRVQTIDTIHSYHSARTHPKGSAGQQPKRSGRVEEMTPEMSEPVPPKKTHSRLMAYYHDYYAKKYGSDEVDTLLGKAATVDSRERLQEMQSWHPLATPESPLPSNRATFTTPIYSMPICSSRGSSWLNWVDTSTSNARYDSSGSSRVDLSAYQAAGLPPLGQELRLGLGQGRDAESKLDR